MKIAILGAGCVGCYVAGQLLQEKANLPDSIFKRLAKRMLNEYRPESPI